MKLDTSLFENVDNLPPPAAICALFTDQMPWTDLLTLLKSIKMWEYDKANLIHWVKVLDYFDEILKQSINFFTPFERSLILEIVRFTLLLLQNCSNIYLYNSIDRLVELLDSPILELVVGSLLIMNEYFSHSTCRNFSSMRKNKKLTERILFLMSCFWNQKLKFNLKTLCNEKISPDLVKAVSEIHFSFYMDSQSTKTNLYSPFKSSLKRSANQQISNIPKKIKTSKSSLSHHSKPIPIFYNKDKPIIVQIPDIRVYKMTYPELIRKIFEEYKIPEKYQMALSYHIRFALGFIDHNQRLQFVRIKLLAFKVALRCSWMKNQLSYFLRHEPQTLEQMIDLLKAGSSVPLDIQVIAMQTLKQGHLGRNVMIELGTCARGGFLPSIIQQSVSHLRSLVTSSSINQQLLASAVVYNKVLYSLVTELLSNNIHAKNALDPSDMLGLALTLLDTPELCFPQLLSRCLGIVVKVITHSSPLSRWIHESGGLEVICRRLRQFTYLNRNQICFVCGLNDGISVCSLPRLQVFITSLLRTFTVAIKQQRIAVKFPSLNDGTFIQTLMDLWRRSSPITANIHNLPPENLGYEVFAASCNLFCAIIQNYPPCLSHFYNAGSTPVILSFLCPSLFSESRTLRAIPETIRSLCLYNKNIPDVQNSYFFTLIFDIFRDTNCLSILDTNTVGFLKKSLDELFRHFPVLVPSGVTSLISVLRFFYSNQPSPTSTDQQLQNYHQMLGNFARITGGLVKSFGNSFITKTTVELIIELGCLSHNHHSGDSDTTASGELLEVMVNFAIRSPTIILEYLNKNLLKMVDLIINLDSFKQFRFLLLVPSEKSNYSEIQSEIRLLESIDWLLAVFLRFCRKVNSSHFSSITFSPIFEKLLTICRQCHWHFFHNFLNQNPIFVSEELEKEYDKICHKYVLAIDEFLSRTSIIFPTISRFLVMDSSSLRSNIQSLKSSRNNWITEICRNLYRMLQWHPTHLTSLVPIYACIHHLIQNCHSVIFSLPKENLNIDVLRAFTKEGGISFLVSILQWIIQPNQYPCPWHLEEKKENETKDQMMLTDLNNLSSKHSFLSSSNLKKGLRSPTLAHQSKENVLIEITNLFNNLTKCSLPSNIISLIIQQFFPLVWYNSPFNSDNLLFFHPDIISFLVNVTNRYMQTKLGLCKKNTSNPSLIQHHSQELEGLISRMIDMGFSRSQVEQSIINTGNMDMAIEWLFTNPEEKSMENPSLINDFNTALPQIFIEVFPEDFGEKPIDQIIMPLFGHLQTQFSTQTLLYNEDNSNYPLNSRKSPFSLSLKPKNSLSFSDIINSEKSSTSILHPNVNTKSQSQADIKHSLLLPHRNPDSREGLLLSISHIINTLCIHPTNGENNQQIIYSFLINSIIKEYQKNGFTRFFHSLLYLLALSLKTDSSHINIIMSQGAYSLILTLLRNFIDDKIIPSVLHPYEKEELICTGLCIINFFLAPTISNSSKETEHSLNNLNEFTSFKRAPPILSESDQLDILRICIDLLKIQHSSHHSLLFPQAQLILLRVISQLTLSYSITEIFGLHALLSLQILQKDESSDMLYIVASQILRHVLEDPLQLQYRMDREIRQSLYDYSHNTNRHVININDFIKMFSPLILRDPDIFFKTLKITPAIRWEKNHLNKIEIHIVPEILELVQQTFPEDTVGCSSISQQCIILFCDLIIQRWNVLLSEKINKLHNSHLQQSTITKEDTSNEKTIKSLNSNQDSSSSSNNEKPQTPQNNFPQNSNYLLDSISLLSFIKDCIYLYPIIVPTLLSYHDNSDIPGLFPAFILENILCLIPWSKNRLSPSYLNIPSILPKNFFDSKSTKTSLTFLSSICCSNDKGCEIILRNVVHSIQYIMKRSINNTTDETKISDDSNGMTIEFISLCALVDLFNNCLRLRRRQVATIMVKVGLFPLLSSLIDWLNLGGIHASKIVGSILKVMEIIARLDTTEPLRKNKKENNISHTSTSNVIPSSTSPTSIAQPFSPSLSEQSVEIFVELESNNTEYDRNISEYDLSFEDNIDDDDDIEQVNQRDIDSSHEDDDDDEDSWRDDILVEENEININHEDDEDEEDEEELNDDEILEEDDIDNPDFNDIILPHTIDSFENQLENNNQDSQNDFISSDNHDIHSVSEGSHHWEEFVDYSGDDETEQHVFPFTSNELEMEIPRFTVSFSRNDENNDGDMELDNDNYSSSSSLHPFLRVRQLPNGIMLGMTNEASDDNNPSNFSFSIQSMINDNEDQEHSSSSITFPLTFSDNQSNQTSELGLIRLLENFSRRFIGLPRHNNNGISNGIQNRWIEFGNSTMELSKDQKSQIENQIGSLVTQKNVIEEKKASNKVITPQSQNKSITPSTIPSQSPELHIDPVVIESKQPVGQTNEFIQSVIYGSIDPGVLAELPPEIRDEVIASQIDASGLNELKMNINPDFLAALPSDIQREVLEQETKIQNQPSHNQEMDSATLLASLPQELREELLLSQDEEFLGTLPPPLLAEAVLLRQRSGEIINQDSLITHQLQENSNNDISITNDDISLNTSSHSKTSLNRQGKPLLPSHILHTIFKPLFMNTLADYQLFYRLIFHLCTYRTTKIKLFEILMALLIPPISSHHNDLSIKPLYRPRSISKLPHHLFGSGDDISFVSELTTYSPNPDNVGTIPSLVFSRLLYLLSYLAQRKPGLLLEFFIPTFKESSSNEDPPLKRRRICEDNKPSTENYFFHLFSLFTSPLLYNNSEHIEFFIHFLHHLFSGASLFDNSSSTPYSLPQLPDSFLKAFVDVIITDRCSIKVFEMSLEVATLLCKNSSHHSLIISIGNSNIEKTSIDLYQQLNFSSNQPFAFSISLVSSLQQNLLRNLRLIRSVQTDSELSLPHNLSQLWVTLGSILDNCSKPSSNPFFSPLSLISILSDTQSQKSSENKEDEKDVEADEALRLLPLVESYFFSNAPNHPPHREEINSFLKDSPFNYILSDPEKIFYQFTERHRRVLNTLCRKMPSLLNSTFKSLLWHPKKVLSFDNKRTFLRQQLRSLNNNRNRHVIRLYVRRDHIFEDSYHQLRLLSLDELKGRLSIRFHNEEGVDLGGLTREWYLALSREIFNPNYALFTHSPGNLATFQPNKFSYWNPEHLSFFHFVGRFVGKAVYDGYFLDAYFTRSFYKHILGIKPNYHDIESIDPDYYKSLSWMLENSIDNVLDLSFSAEINEFGMNKMIELKPDGLNLNVSDENKSEYIQLITDLKMTKEIEQQIKHFIDGFHELISDDLISIFNEHELELLMCGLPEINIEDWKNHTEYYGYTSQNNIILWFWKFVEECTHEERARLVQFVTGTSKVPLSGFKDLQGMTGTQMFQIHRSAKEDTLLPSAHTCMNQLDLPEYSSFEILSEKLLYAIHEGCQGFGFS